MPGPKKLLIIDPFAAETTGQPSISPAEILDPCPHCGNSLAIHPMRWESKTLGVLTCNAGRELPPVSPARPTPTESVAERTRLRELAERARDAHADVIRSLSTTSRMIADSAYERLHAACTPEVILALVSLAERHEALRLSIRQQLIDRNRIVPSESALLDDLVAVVFDELASADVAREEAEEIRHVCRFPAGHDGEHSRHCTVDSIWPPASHPAAEGGTPGACSCGAGPDGCECGHTREPAPTGDGAAPGAAEALRREYDDLAVRYHAMGNQMCREAVKLATVEGEREAAAQHVTILRAEVATLTALLTTGGPTDDDHGEAVRLAEANRLYAAHEASAGRAAPPGETAPRFRYVLYDVDDTLDEGIEEAGSGPAGSERSCTTLGEATAHLERAMAGQADRDIGLLYDENRVVAIAVRHGADVRTLAAPRAPDAGGPTPDPAASEILAHLRALPAPEETPGVMRLTP